MPIVIDRVDHIVLNCRDLETTVAWYQRVLGMRREEFGDYRHTALKFGRQKFNVRPSGKKDWWSVKNDGPGRSISASSPGSHHWRWSRTAKPAA